MTKQLKQIFDLVMLGFGVLVFVFGLVGIFSYAAKLSTMYTFAMLFLLIAGLGMAFVGFCGFRSSNAPMIVVLAVLVLCVLAILFNIFASGGTTLFGVALIGFNVWPLLALLVTLAYLFVPKFLR